MEEHDESGDDAGAAGHERDASRSLAGESRADADDPRKRPKRTHVGRKVVARLFGLNDHRNPEHQGENAAGEGDAIGNLTSSCHLSVVTAALVVVSSRLTGCLGVRHRLLAAGVAGRQGDSFFGYFIFSLI